MPDMGDAVITSDILEVINEKQNLGKKLKRHESLWFNNIIGVRRSNVTFAMTDDELEEYIKCKMSVKYFADNYCQIKREDGTVGQMTLRDYQENIIDLYSKNRYSILMASRQTGKTVSAAIVILHFVLFNDDKGAMIVANKGKTTQEIIRKIKDIYRLTPFFLKKGVSTWNERSISFENNSRIQTENRTREPAIGFTIDLLYLDEFAHIPDNIVRDYYGAIVPVVSSIENSKIMITSTPYGYNLFYELLKSAELSDDDPNKNPYKPMRVYWWQVKGRRDTKINILDKKLEKYKYIKSVVLRELRQTHGLKFYKKTESGVILSCVSYDVEDKRTYIDNIRKIRVHGVPLPELAVISNWQEEETKLIGGEEKFKQEYDLHFVAGDKLLFDRITMDILKSRIEQFEFKEFDLLNEKLLIPYNNLQWIKDKPDIFDVANMKNYHIYMSIDLSEGLAKDYSVINIFRLIPRTMKDIELNSKSFKNIYDLFQLEQIGIFRNNIYSIRELAHIFYLIGFELFDPEKVKVVLEYNTYGAEFLAHLPNVFEGDNEYFNAVFTRYKHNKTDKYKKIGIKISRDKHLIVDKDFQQVMKKNKMIVHNDTNINEISTFSRHETIGGRITYRADSGNDDTVMTTVILSTAFDSVDFKNLVDMLISSGSIGKDMMNFIENFAEESVGNTNVIEFASSYNKIYNRPYPKDYSKKFPRNLF